MNFFFFIFFFSFLLFPLGGAGELSFLSFLSFLRKQCKQKNFLADYQRLDNLRGLNLLACMFARAFFNNIRRWAVGVILSAVFIFGQHAIFAVKSPFFASFESRKPLVHSVANVLRGG
jgi:hypothetical protein